MRIHLSTAVVMMLVAGALLGLNIRGSKVQFGEYAQMDIFNTVMGWPFPAQTVESTLGHWPRIDNDSGFITFWQLDGLAADIAITLAIVSVSAFIVEWSLRRRSRSAVEQRA